jgi:hypothetical protein
MLKELGYEWCLFSLFWLFGDIRCRGFYDNNKVYEKKGWLNWKVQSHKEFALSVKEVSK